MPDALKFDRIRKELPGVCATLGLVGVLTIALFSMVWELGLEHGSVVYLLPVVIAATRWGIVSAIVAAVCGVLASAFFFYPPLYSFRITNPQEVINLILFIFVAVVVSQLATRLKSQLEMAHQRETDLRDLYAFSRRLAVAFDVSDIHAAIEDHLATVMQRKVVLFASARDASGSSGRRAGVTVPEPVLTQVVEVASSRRDANSGVTVTAESGDVWLIRAVSPKSSEFGVIAIDLDRESQEGSDELRIRVDAVLADATATLERLGVAHAISEARMRSQTDQLREALIGSVSHELRTPLASILGAATVLSAAPALANEKKLRALVHDVRDEAERLNNDIQNLLDASRISSDGLKPHIEWADPADIVNSAIERCRNRMADRRIVLNLPADLPLIHVDPVLVEQALVQIFDNAVKYSHAGSQIDGDRARARRPHDPERQRRRRRTDRGRADENMGPFRARRTPCRDHQRFRPRALDRQRLYRRQWWQDERRQRGPGLGTTVAIELPVTQAAVPQMESDADE